MGTEDGKIARRRVVGFLVLWDEAFMVSSVRLRMYYNINKHTSSPLSSQYVSVPVKNYEVPNTITGTNIPRHTVPTYIYSKSYMICTRGKCQLSFLRTIKFTLNLHRN